MNRNLSKRGWGKTAILTGTFLVTAQFPAKAQPVIPGSTAFCLFEVPTDDTGKRKWINLGIVQYVEATSREVRIVYGAGAFGAGHEARIPVEDDDKARLVLEKLRRVAAACR